MLKILSMLKEISKSNDKKTDGQPYTTDMPELESEQESAEQEKKAERTRIKNTNTRSRA